MAPRTPEESGWRHWRPPELLGDPNLYPVQALKKAVRLPLLSHDDLAECGRLIEDGRQAKYEYDLDESLCDDARSQLEERIQSGLNAQSAVVVHHVPMIIGMAYDFAADLQILGDVTSHAAAELVEATAQYKITEGATYTAFARTVVFNAMLNYVTIEYGRKTGLSRGMREMLRDIRFAQKTHEENGYILSTEEAAERLNFDRDYLAKALILKQTVTTSLDIKELEDGSRLIDQSSEQEFDDVLDQILLGKIWSTAQAMKDRDVLSDREWFILINRYRNGLSQADIGKKIGIAQKGVSDWEQKILDKIKAHIGQPYIFNMQEVYAAKDVKRPAHLLTLLNIRIDNDTDVASIAAEIIECSGLTAKQRLVMHRLLGTNGTDPVTTTELARELNVTRPAIRFTRDGAVNKIINAQTQQQY